MGSCWQPPCPAWQFHQGLSASLILLTPEWRLIINHPFRPLVSTLSLPDGMHISLRTGKAHSFQLFNFRYLPFSAQSATLVQSRLVRVLLHRQSGDNHLGYCRYRRPLSNHVSSMPCGSHGDRCHSSKEVVEQAQGQAEGINVRS